LTAALYYEEELMSKEKKEKLILNKETIKVVKVKSAIKTGMSNNSKIAEYC
jgi:hypothetical protein